jgi:hypothetical protein
MCFVEPWVEIMATPALMCTPDDLAHGRNIVVARRGEDPVGMSYVCPLGLSNVWRTD